MLHVCNIVLHAARQDSLTSVALWFCFKFEPLALYSSTMTMEELLTSLQKKCRTECEEAHRQLVCALNGLAGIHIIKGKTGWL